jgi:S1-C subfamily serine protease
MENRAYSWDLPVEVRAGSLTRVELTNANARVDSALTAMSARQIAPEMALYERVRRGVVKVQSGMAHGSGFLVDSARGYVVTNDHVVDAAFGGEMSVYVDETMRVSAQVLATDHQADLAVLRVNPSLVGTLPQLPLARPDSSGSIALAGERVLAIGYPLTQRSTVTTGIVSGVREGAVLSDVLIDHGNSGGPMLNMAGEVIAVNTFGTHSEPGGLGGAVSVARLTPLLAQATQEAARTPSPPAARLPVVPSASYPLARIRSIADTARDRAYRDLQESSFGRFVVSFFTPVSQFVAYRQYEDEISKNRRAREARAGLTGQERFASFGPMRDWSEYVGDETAPVVTVTITPKVGETSGSVWGRVLGAAFVGAAYQQRSTVEFKSDVHSARFYRNGQLVTPILGGRTEQRAFVDNAWVSMRDVAYRGLYVLSPGVFAPDSSGMIPSIILVVRDLKNLDQENVWELYPSTVARIWNDFLPYVAAGGLSGTRVQFSSQPFRSGIRDFCETRNCWHGSQENPLLAGLRVAGADDSSGVIVTAVSSRSPLYQAGLRNGQLVVSVNGRPTPTWAAFERAVSLESADSVVLGTTGYYDRRRQITTVRALRPQNK